MTTPEKRSEGATAELLALHHVHDPSLRIGELIVVVSVFAANIVRDVRENLRNLVGGRMDHYEDLIQNAVDRALQDLALRATDKGYDGVIGVTITHPSVVDGGVEVIVYGNGFTRTNQGISAGPGENR